MRGLRGLSPSEHGHSDRSLFVPAPLARDEEGAGGKGAAGGKAPPPPAAAFDAALADAWCSAGGGGVDFGVAAGAPLDAANRALGLARLDDSLTI
eukprot:tig00000396_g24873.t1